MKLKIVFLFSIVASASLINAMDEPPASCTTPEQKQKYTELQAALILADVEKIKACGFDLNTPCMNICSSYKDHPTYPIEWVIAKTYDTRCIVALLQAGVDARGYDDYSPLMDLTIRDLNCNDCIQILYNAGADPNTIVRTRTFNEQLSPLAYVRQCKSKIKLPIWYKADQRKLDRLNELETILSSPRQPFSTVPTPTTGVQVQQGQNNRLLQGLKLSDTSEPQPTVPFFSMLRVKMSIIMIFGAVCIITGKYFYERHQENKKKNETDMQDAEDPTSVSA